MEEQERQKRLKELDAQMEILRKEERLIRDEQNQEYLDKTEAYWDSIKNKIFYKIIKEYRYKKENSYMFQVIIPVSKGDLSKYGSCNCKFFEIMVEKVNDEYIVEEIRFKKDTYRRDALIPGANMLDKDSEYFIKNLINSILPQFQTLITQVDA